MQLRKNVYDLVAYLNKNAIAHFLAHMLYDMNSQMSLNIVEKMLLLFSTFEVKNGSRSKRYNSMIARLIGALNQETMERIAEKHGKDLVGNEPWTKGMVGGSDDHSGFFIGRSFTVSHRGATLSEFINGIREAQVWAEGEDGDALMLSHSIYGIGYQFFKEKIEPKQSSQFPFITALMNWMFNPDGRKASLVDRINLFIKMGLPGVKGRNQDRTLEQIINKEAKRLLNDSKFIQPLSTADVNRRIFAVTSTLVNRLIYIYTERLAKQYTSLGLVDLIHSLGAIGIVHLLASPYYVAFHHQHRSKALVREIASAFSIPSETNGRQKIALFTDTLHEINGVAITIKRMIEVAKARNTEFVVITASGLETGFNNGIMNFRSVGEFTLPEYPELKLHFPPILDIIDYFDREGFTSIHASTPGTMGLLALLIAKLMDIPVSGTYHTDIPQYVKSLTNDSFLEDVAWNYIIWFYNLMDEVMVPSSSTRRQLIEKGLVAEKTRPLPRWVDQDMFAPEKKDPAFWGRYGMNGVVKFLYAGRLSREKNLEFLADAFKTLIDSGESCDLIFVGDGPYRQELENTLAGYPVLFTGFLSGDDLARAYASSEVFVFPSNTDTFGNVVLEAQASGLPVIVSDQGGPQEFVRDGLNGFIVKANDIASLISAMNIFIADRRMAATMGREARLFIESQRPPEHEMYSTILCDTIPVAAQQQVQEKNPLEYITGRGRPEGKAILGEAVRAEN